MALFTVIEGADGCGKTTQAQMLVDMMLQSELGAIELSFPRYNTPLGQAISRHLKGEISLTDLKDPRRLAGAAEEDDLVFQALQTMDKYEAAHDIREALLQGSNVVSSRWWQSAVIYGGAMNLTVKSLLAIHESLPRADLNVLLWATLEESIARRPDMRDRLETDRGLQKRVLESYRQMWAEQGASLTLYDKGPKEDLQGNYWLVVDGRDSEVEVHNKIWRGFLYVLQARAKEPNN